MSHPANFPTRQCTCGATYPAESEPCHREQVTTGRTTAAHPAVQVERINDIRAEVHAFGEARRRLDESRRNTLDAISRAQGSGITYAVLIAETPEEIARSASSLRRKVAAHRQR